MAGNIFGAMALGIFWWLSGPGTALAQPGRGAGGYWGPHMMFGGSWWGWIMMILFWALIVAGLVALIRWLVTSWCPPEGGRSVGNALEILKERYARGEIDKEEFESIKKDILAD